ncbi:hypothetical protein SSS_05160 [Sarcoptes scabiei]|uniref:SH3 domain-containing protein n=1 Tax=Sarcoptes scabiei TaxID=52283 RepID=A0A834R5M1_SARSC|nr:hypothetical protein SSS_05160 [Sarcoptes scabiei]
MKRPGDEDRKIPIDEESEKPIDGGMEKPTDEETEKPREAADEEKPTDEETKKPRKIKRKDSHKKPAEEEKQITEDSIDLKRRESTAPEEQEEVPKQNQQSKLKLREKNKKPRKIKRKDSHKKPVEEEKQITEDSIDLKRRESTAPEEQEEVPKTESTVEVETKRKIKLTKRKDSKPTLVEGGDKDKTVSVTTEISEEIVEMKRPGDEDRQKPIDEESEKPIDGGTAKPTDEETEKPTESGEEKPTDEETKKPRKIKRKDSHKKPAEEEKQITEDSIDFKRRESTAPEEQEEVPKTESTVEIETKRKVKLTKRKDSKPTLVEGGDKNKTESVTTEIKSEKPIDGGMAKPTDEETEKPTETGEEKPTDEETKKPSGSDEDKPTDEETRDKVMGKTIDLTQKDYSKIPSDEPFSQEFDVTDVELIKTIRLSPSRLDTEDSVSAKIIHKKFPATVDSDAHESLTIVKSKQRENDEETEKPRKADSREKPADDEKQITEDSIDFKRRESTAPEEQEEVPKTESTVEVETKRKIKLTKRKDSKPTLVEGGDKDKTESVTTEISEEIVEMKRSGDEDRQKPIDEESEKPIDGGTAKPTDEETEKPTESGEEKPTDEETRDKVMGKTIDLTQKDYSKIPLSPSRFDTEDSVSAKIIHKKFPATVDSDAHESLTIVKSKQRENDEETEKPRKAGEEKPTDEETKKPRKIKRKDSREKPADDEKQITEDSIDFKRRESTAPEEQEEVPKTESTVEVETKRKVKLTKRKDSKPTLVEGGDKDKTESVTTEISEEIVEMKRPGDEDRQKPIDEESEKPIDGGTAKPTDEETEKPTESGEEKPTDEETKKPSGADEDKPTDEETRDKVMGKTIDFTQKDYSKIPSDEPFSQEFDVTDVELIKTLRLSPSRLDTEDSVSAKIIHKKFPATVDSDAHESLTIVKSKQRENDEFLKENEILQQTTDEKITKPDSMQKNVSKKLSIKQDSKDLEFYEFDDVNSKLYEKEYSETNVSQLIRLRSQSTNQDQYVENIFRCRSAPDFDETEVSATIEKIVKKYSEISTEIIIKQRSKPTESIVESEPCVVILPAKPQTYQIEEASAELKIVIDSLEYRYLSSKMIDELVCNQSYSSAVPSVISLRKGDRIYVVERVNQDWWFVRKKITNEFGFAPAEFIIDDVSYTHILNKSIDHYIDSLIVDGKRIFLIFESDRLSHLFHESEPDTKSGLDRPCFIDNPPSNLSFKSYNKIYIDFRFEGSFPMDFIVSKKHKFCNPIPE